MSNYPFFEVEKIPAQHTAILYLNRPEKLNAMSWPFWRDLATAPDASITCMTSTTSGHPR